MGLYDRDYMRYSPPRFSPRRSSPPQRAAESPRSRGDSADFAERASEYGDGSGRRNNWSSPLAAAGKCAAILGVVWTLGAVLALLIGWISGNDEVYVWMIHAIGVICGTFLLALGARSCWGVPTLTVFCLSTTLLFLAMVLNGAFSGGYASGLILLVIVVAGPIWLFEAGADAPDEIRFFRQYVATIVDSLTRRFRRRYSCLPSVRLFFAGSSASRSSASSVSWPSWPRFSRQLTIGLIAVGVVLTALIAIKVHPLNLRPIWDWLTNGGHMQQASNEQYSEERRRAAPGLKDDERTFPKPRPRPSHPFGEYERARHELQPLPQNPFEGIDAHARACPDSAERDVASLAAYLGQAADTDLEKARGIYVWLAENIEYDDDAFNAGIFGDYTAQGVLNSRKSVCEGFSELYLALGKATGLKILKVSGYAKGYGYTDRGNFTEPNHAWNLIRIAGRWRVFDATWGQGSSESRNGRLVTRIEFDDSWFNVDPYEAIFTHLPEDIVFAEVYPPIDLSEFETFPEVDQEYFELGFNAQETYKSAHEKRDLRFPKCYPIATHIEARSAPKYEELHINQPYQFEFYVPRGIDVAITDAQNNWTHFTRDREPGVFKLEYTPKTDGELGVWAYMGGRDSASAVMTYTVRDAAVTVKSEQEAPHQRDGHGSLGSHTAPNLFRPGRPLSQDTIPEVAIEPSDAGQSSEEPYSGARFTQPAAHEEESPAEAVADVAAFDRSANAFLFDLNKEISEFPIEGQRIPGVERLYLRATAAAAVPGDWEFTPSSQVSPADGSITIRSPAGSTPQLEFELTLAKRNAKPAVIFRSYYYRGDRREPLSGPKLRERLRRVQRAYESNTRKLAGYRRALPGLQNEVVGLRNLFALLPRYDRRRPFVQGRLHSAQRRVISTNSGIASLERSLPKTKDSHDYLASVKQLADQLHLKATIGFEVGIDSRTPSTPPRP